MDFSNLGHRVRQDEDPCVDTYLDTDWFDKAYAGRAKVYHNLYLNERVFLRLAIVSEEGLYAIVPYRDRAEAGQQEAYFAAQTTSQMAEALVNLLRAIGGRHTDHYSDDFDMG